MQFSKELVHSRNYYWVQQLTNSSQSVINKPIWTIALVSLFTDMASEMLYPIMPIYLDSIGYGAALIGFLEGIAEMVAGLSKPYFGAWSDQLQKRVPFIKAGYALSAISKPLFALSSAMSFVFSLRILDRIGKGLRSAPRDALLSDLSTIKNKATVFGFHRSMDTIGAVAGPLIALLFLTSQENNYSGLFIWALIPGVIAIVLTFLLREAKPREPVQIKEKPIGFAINYWRKANTSYKKLVFIFITFALVNSSDVFLLLRAKELGYSTSNTILLYVGFNVVYAVSAFPFGKLSDKFGHKNILALGLLVFAFVYIGMSWIDGKGYLFASIFLLYGLYYAAIEGILRACLSNLVPKTETAQALGFFNGLQSMAFLFASTWFGLVWSSFGSSIAFASVATVVLVLTILLFSMIKNETYE